MKLTHERLLEVMDYDPETGIACWKTKTAARANRINPGDEMGTKAGCGYIYISIDNEKMPLHRAIFFFMTKRWPKIVDHINLNKMDNRWKNLREANGSQSGANKDAQSNNTTGWKGVSFAPATYRKNRKSKKKFYVAYHKRKYLGSFDCPAAASFAYQIEADKAFGEFARW